MRAKKLNGFSLMEMMVVLLIVAIIAAASAPMVTKKLSRSAGTNDSPWVFTGLNNSIAYNMNGNNNSSAIIGAAEVSRSAGQPMPKLYIENSGNEPQLGFGSRGQEGYVSLLFDRINNRVAFSDAATIPSNSVALGINQNIASTVADIIALGNNINIPYDHWNQSALAIGNNIQISPRNGIAIGFNIGLNETGDGYTNSSGIMIGDKIQASSGIAIGDSGWLDQLYAADNAVAIGSSTRAETSHSTAVGHRTIAQAMSATSIGEKTVARGERAVAIGYRAVAGGEEAICIATTSNKNSAADDRRDPLATGRRSIAIGWNAKATAERAVAIGHSSCAKHKRAIVIGDGVDSTAEQQITLGSLNDTVYIPGNLVVGKNVILNRNGGHTSVHAYGQHDQVGVIADKNPYSAENNDLAVRSANSINSSKFESLVNQYSDRRLKNVGEKYTAGLAELKKLDFFHFTFKEDKEKTPHVGVMAQDLEKVFPDAVTKGEDGYLRIRWDDMFYAVINAVKELDNKIAEIVQNITDINSTIEKQNKTIEEQAKVIEEQNIRLDDLEKINSEQTKKLETQAKDIDNLIKRIEKLEGK